MLTRFDIITIVQVVSGGNRTLQKRSRAIQAHKNNVGVGERTLHTNFGNGPIHTKPLETNLMIIVNLSVCSKTFRGVYTRQSISLTWNFCSNTTILVK